MGVPKFFRYMSERYPCLSESLKEYQIPEFDNLYLDMNGIIHNCSHPNDADVKFRITEETIFKNIFHYIEILFRIIQPRKLFFMAVDGVAPRAKINQQRGRRFRSAKEAELLEAKAKAKGEFIPESSRFDSNCITPGTLFMANLNDQLRYFIAYKISTDKLWQKCKVVFSGSEVPGEGEHKIMDYIRYMKSQPDYDNNTRHCLYGLDADLIMLGLCTHEPHFSLLREEVKFGKQQKRILTPEETKFCLLHLSLMREYIEHEFSPVKDKLSFPFDIEKIIDDWVLMGFLVGNDFIPNLPNLHINQGALPVLYHAYMEVLPTLEGYINEAGTLKLDRFEKFMEKLSRVDMEQFAEHYADLKYFEGKTGRKVTGVDRNNFKRSEDSPEEVPSLKKTNSDLDSLIKSTDDMLIGHSDEEDLLDDDSDSDMYNVEFVLHKRDYYMKKLEYENVDEHVLRSQAEGYVRAIQWNLHYYYDGCCSWSWYYPHHYAPYISDIKDFKDLKLEFELGEPFLPFQQLLAVLPAASKTLLPEAFQNLLTEEESPIIDYYPLEFKTDLNGKRQEWEAVVLIPFIDEKNLLEAMKPYYSQLTPEEQKRNKHGPMSIFTYTEQDMGTYEAPAYFPNIQCHAKWELVERSSILVPEDKLVKGLCKGVRLDVYFPGFPTLRHIKHTAGLKKAKVKVFEQPSRGENMMLTIVPQQLPNLNDIAERLLGKSIFVGWPHLVEAQVVAVSNSSLKLNLIQLQMAKISRNIQQEQLQSAAVTQWTSQGNAIKEVYETRYGIDIGDIKVLVHARPIVGRRYAFGTHGKICLEKQWSEVTNTYAYQAIVENVAVADPSFVLYKSIFDIFVAKSVCFMLGHPHYGAFGEVIEPGVNPKNGRVKVAMRIMQEPSLDYNQQNHRDSQNLYANGNIASQRLGITRILLSRITGTIYVMGRAAELTGLPKHNIGLNLKFSKKNEEVPGYTRKDQSGEWLYSPKAIDLVRDYMQKFPRVFERLGKIVKNDIFHEHELFDEGSTEKLGDLTSWLKEQQSHNTESRACNMYGLDAETVQKIQKSIDDFLEQHKNTSKVVVMQVKPHLLYKPGLNLGYLSPDEKATHMLFDRIITVKENFTVPLGYKGTIVAIHKSENVLDITYDVLFDKSFVGGLTLYECSPNRCYRLSPVDFINISYGERVEREKTVGPSDLDMFSGANQSRMHVSPHEFSRNCNMEAPSSENYKSILLPAPPKKVEKRNETKDALQLNQMKPSFEHPPFQIPQHNMNLPKPAFSRNSSTNQVLQSPQDRKPAQSSEFQALWNELHKKPSTPASNALPSPPMAKPNQTPQIPPVRPHALGDLSALLKAMLKIPDDRSQNNTSSRSTTTPTNKNPFPQPSKATDAPPLVQQLFDQARQAEKKKDDIWYCSQLLEHFQLNGRGMPRYNYFNNQGLVQAQIFLPDMRQFVGELCATRDQAAESAAKIAYKALNLDKAPKPNMNVLFPPPMQWYNSRQNTPRVPNRLPMMPPYPQTPPNPLLHQPQWNQKMPQPPNNLPNPAFVRMIPPPPLSNCGPIRPPLPPQQQQQQQQPQQQQQQQQQLHQQHPHHTVHQNSGDIENWRTDKKQTAKNASENWRNDKKNETKKSTPFVPLQAQKRNVNSKLSTSKNTAQNVSQNSKQSPQGGNKKQQDKPQDPVSKDTKESKQNKNDNKTDNIQKTPQSSQPQESSRKRRSRIAANFSSSPLSNGDKPQ